jgi:hypothetical protein
MYPRLDDDGPWQLDGRDEAWRSPGPARLRADRIEQIRERIALDAYRSVEVVDEIARQILRRQDL